MDGIQEIKILKNKKKKKLKQKKDGKKAKSGRSRFFVQCPQERKKRRKQ
jgi:hypothetical protein